MSSTANSGWSRSPVGPIRVLHVEDDPAFADLTATYLEREYVQLTVETATSASEGLDRLAESDIDCIVSDHDMPARTGIDFLKAVRETAPDLPFILFTGKGSEEIASEAISAGVTDYVQKKGGTNQYTILANRIRNAVERTFAQRERQRHLDAIETAREGISILDADERFIYVNQAFAQMYGYGPEEMIGESWELVYSEDDVETLHEEILPAITDTGSWYGETIGARADGTTFVQEQTCSTTDNGEFVCIVRDLTDHKERERRFEAIFNNAYTFVGLLDTDGTVLEANETILEFGGLTREEVVGTPVWDTVWFQSNKEARTLARKAVEQARTGESSRAELRLRGADREALIEFTVRPVTDEQGNVTALVPEGRDITQLKRQVRRMETLVDNVPGLVYRCRNEPGWPMEHVAGSVEELTGYSPSALETEAVLFGDDIVHPDDRDGVRETVNGAVERQEPFELTYRIVTKEGETKSVSERGQCVASVEGDETFLEGFITDITARQEMADALHKERSFIEQALDSLEDVFCAVRADGALHRWNDRLSDVTGYTDEELSTMQFVDLYPNEERERIADAIEETLTTGPIVIESELLTADGNRIAYEFSCRRITQPETDLIGLVGIDRDVTSASG